MRKFNFNIQNSTANSNNLMLQVSREIDELRAMGHSPQMAIAALIGADMLENYDWPMDWLDAKIIAFHEIKKQVIEGRVKYDA